MKRWPFKVTSSNGDPRIHVTHNGHPKVLSPQEVSAMVLRKLKQSAEARLGHAVTEAVITVPAYFTDSQKKATREAGEMAGLKVLRLLPEPTAAALAYGHGLKDNVTEKTVLIYDLGGGTFDVSIVTVSRGRFVVRGVGGNSHLGGTDIDQIILKHAAQVIPRAMRHDVTGNPSKMRRLLERCERAKRDLSTQSRCDIDTESIVPDELPLPLSRDELEELCRDLLRSTTDTVKSVLATAKVAAADISEVILVGGSTRMPVVERLLSEVFPGKPVCKTVNPDEAVAQGAALCALHLLQDKAPDVQELAPFLRRLDIQNVTPLSVGVECNEWVVRCHHPAEHGHPGAEGSEAMGRRSTTKPPPSFSVIPPTPVRNTPAAASAPMS
ncbi:hypothetical protein ONE63_011565 [Megalurothrips usitatus]|uniref:Uncharacterized protein n=1 Tax=Megalurothrips usitatus TaxID=439358 RepID=A0AAV7X5C4_9NEOP|nr:hypothetical protein ONE63_011565 [Megalurothrips usitatus]